MSDPGVVVVVTACLASAVALWSVAWRSIAAEEGRRAATASFWPDLEAAAERDRVRSVERARRLGVSHLLRMEGDGSGGGHRSSCTCGWVSPVLVSDGLAVSAWCEHWHGEGTGA